MTLLELAGRRFARLVTTAVISRPRMWRWLRPLFARQWNLIAPTWDCGRRADSLDPYLAALEALPISPAAALDVGTGTGAGALAVARRFPAASVAGVDLSEAMIAQAAPKVRASSGHVRFLCGDASALPFRAASFDLVTHSNMIPFFDEVARVVRPGGFVLFAFSSGADTPIYVPDERLESELRGRGFTDFKRVARSRGTALVARKTDDG